MRKMSLVRGCLLSTAVRQCAKQQRLVSSVSSAQQQSPVSSTNDALYKRIQLEMCAHDKAVLQSYTSVLQAAASHLAIKQGNFEMSRKSTKDRLTLLKSVHIYKKHRVQYEIRTHRASLELHHLTGSTADTYLEYVQRCLPEGVSMKVTRVALEKLPEHIKPPS